MISYCIKNKVYIVYYYRSKNSKAPVLIHSRIVYFGVEVQANHLPCLGKHIWTVCLEMFLSKFPISQRARALSLGARLGSNPFASP